MTNHFKAKVELRQTVEVVAETETEARRKAKQAGLQRVPSADVWVVELSSFGGTHLEVGSRIKHKLFGSGEILVLSRSTNANNDRGFRATIQFDSGEKHELHLPHASVTSEALGA